MEICSSVTKGPKVKAGERLFSMQPFENPGSFHPIALLFTKGIILICMVKARSQYIHVPAQGKKKDCCSRISFKLKTTQKLHIAFSFIPHWPEFSPMATLNNKVS